MNPSSCRNCGFHAGLCRLLEQACKTSASEGDRHVMEALLQGLRNPSRGDCCCMTAFFLSAVYAKEEALKLFEETSSTLAVLRTCHYVDTHIH